MIGWILVGLLAVGFAAQFWDQIRFWLNNSAANAVEKVLGYKARERMHRATTKITRVMDSVKNLTTVFVKKNKFDTTYDKVTMSADAKAYEIDAKILEEIRTKGELVQEFGYSND